MDAAKDRTDSLQHLKYWAFVSYSHRDSEAGEWLHQALESYRLPRRLVGREGAAGPIPKRLFPVFRDTAELPAGASLSREIQAALESAKYLIVICSPAAAQSAYVDEEIRYFRSLGGANRVLSLIIAGEPNVAPDALDSAQECFPEALRRSFKEETPDQAASMEPIAADARGGRSSRHTALLRLVAGMLGLSFDELQQRDRQRRNRRRTGMVVTALAIVAALLGTWQWQEWRKQREILEQTIASYTSIGQKELAAGNRQRAAAYLGEAYRLGGEGLGLRLLLADAMESLDLAGTNWNTDGGPATTVRFDPSGERLLSVSGPAAARLWDGDGQLIADLDHAGTRIDASAFLRAGDGLLTGGADGSIRFWDLQQGRLLGRIAAHQSPVADIAVSADNRRFAAIGIDGSASVWTLPDLQRVSTLEAEFALRPPAVFSPDGTRLATRGYVGDHLMIWEMPSGRLLHSVRLDDNTEWLQFDAEGTTILVAPRGGAPTLVGVADGLPVATLASSLADLIYMAPLEDPTQVLLMDRLGKAEVWELPSSERRTAFDTGIAGARIADFDGRRLVLLEPAPSAVFSVWDVIRGERAVRVDPISPMPVAAAQRPGHGELVTGAGDGSLTTWHLDRRSGHRMLSGHRVMVNFVTFSPDGTELITAGSETTASVWDGASGDLQQRLRRHEAAVYSASYSVDGRYLVTLGGEGAIAVWERRDGRLELERYIPRFGADRLLVSPARNMTVAVVSDDQLALWRPLADQVAFLDRVRGGIEKIAFSPDGTTLASGNADGSVDLWRVVDASLVAKFWQHQARISDLDFDSDGRRLLVSSDDASASVWSVDTGEPLLTIAGHSDAVNSARFSPDGRRIATAGKDSRVRLWDATDGRMLASLDEHAGGVSRIAFSPDGGLLATAGEEPVVRLWDIARGELIRALPPHRDSVLDIVFSPDGRWLASAAKEPEARLWRIRTEARSRAEIATLLERKLPFLIADGRLILKRSTSDPANSDVARGHSAIDTMPPDRVVQQFLDALASGDRAKLRPLIAADANWRLVQLKDDEASSLKDLNELFAGHEGIDVKYRADRTMALVTVALPRGRVDFYLHLQETDGQWQLTEIRARSNPMSGWLPLDPKS